MNSDAYKQGYEAYYNDIDDCPYSYDTERDFWDEWCNGHFDAYCIGEGK
jgi:hypothetical protein